MLAFSPQLHSSVGEKSLRVICHRFDDVLEQAFGNEMDYAMLKGLQCGFRRVMLPP